MDAYSDVARRVQAARAEHVHVEPYGVGPGEPLLCARVAAVPDAPTALLTAGVHGDEPAGVEAAMRFLETLVAANTRSLGWLVAPCVNPSGYAAGTRENADGADINRAFDQDPTPESTALKELLADRRFVFAVDFHEDWEADGFYMYEGVGEATAAGEDVVRAVAEVGNIDEDTDPDDPPISPGVYPVSTSWGTIGLAPYLLATHTPHVVITETPSRAWDWEQRVRAHLRALDVVSAHHRRDEAAK